MKFRVAMAAYFSNRVKKEKMSSVKGLGLYLCAAYILWDITWTLSEKD